MHKNVQALADTDVQVPNVTANTVCYHDTTLLSDGNTMLLHRQQCSNCLATTHNNLATNTKTPATAQQPYSNVLATTEENTSNCLEAIHNIQATAQQPHRTP